MAQRASAVPSQLLKSPHSKHPVLRVYPSSPVGIQLPRSLETWRINSRAVLISRSRYHHRPPRRTYGGDVSSPVGLVRITLSASVAREKWSLSGGLRVGWRIMNGERELATRTMIRPSTPDRSHSHRRRRVNRDSYHIHQRRWTKTSPFRSITGQSGCMPSRLSGSKRV
jgi:hypothetical protein